MATNWRVRLSREAKAPDERVELMHQANPAVKLYLVTIVLKRPSKMPWIKRITGPFEKLLEVLSSPYEDLEGLREYMLPPKPEEHVLKTFCGT